MLAETLNFFPNQEHNLLLHMQAPGWGGMQSSQPPCTDSKQSQGHQAAVLDTALPPVPALSPLSEIRLDMVREEVLRTGTCDIPCHEW